MAVPKKRTSISKKRIRKKSWKRKAYWAALSALSLKILVSFVLWFTVTIFGKSSFPYVRVSEPKVCLEMTKKDTPDLAVLFPNLRSNPLFDIDLEEEKKGSRNTK